MGFLDIFRGGRKPTVVRRSSSYGFSFLSEDRQFGPEQALEVGAVFACVKAISEAVAATPFTLNQTTTKNGRKFRQEVADHWAASLLDNPNPYQTRAEFLETVMLSAMLGSGSLIYKVIVGGKVKELWPVPAGSWTQEVLDNGRCTYTITMAGGHTNVADNEVIFIHGPSLTGYASTSAIGHARRVLGISTSLTTTQRQFADNQGTPRGIITMPENVPDDQRDAILEAIKAKFSAGASGLLLLEGAATFTSLSQTFGDSKFLEQKADVTKEICALFSVPTSMVLGGEVKPTDLTAFSQLAVRPWIIRIEQALTKQLLGGLKGFAFDGDEHAALRSDPIQQIAFLTKAIGAGGQQAILSVNEARQFLGYNPIDSAEYDVVSRGGYAEAAGLKDEPAEKEQSETDIL